MTNYVGPHSEIASGRNAEQFMYNIRSAMVCNIVHDDIVNIVHYLESMMIVNFTYHVIVPSVVQD
jgi:hypothetical protein